MRRRQVLGVVCTAAVGTAGCLGLGRTDDQPDSTPEPCSVDRVEPVDPDSEEVQPRDLPDRPDQLTAANVETYVKTYESAYRQHLILTADTVEYGHSIYESNVVETDGGYRVELQTKYYYEEMVDGGRVHADSPFYDVVYRVTEDRLLRAAMERPDGEPDLDEAKTMECWTE